MAQNSDREKKARRTTEGKRLFVKKLEELRLSQAAAAKQLGVSQPTVNAWCTGAKRPEPEWRERIEAEYGVPRDAWYTRSERTIAQPEVRS